MKPIKVLVVDDSLFFRNVLVQCLQTDPNIEVVAQAGDAYQARDAIIKYNPDVMTLDVEMPKMNGIDFLKKLMPQYPLPVVAVSSSNSKVFDALEAGAVDFVNKPAGLDRTKLNDFVKNELVTKIKIASTVKVGNMKRVKPIADDMSLKNKKLRHSVIAIGASTGGTEAILEVIKRFGNDIPGIVMVQHMPVGFTKMYADRLNNQCRILVKEAQTGDIIMPGQALLAPADRQMKKVAWYMECRKWHMI